VLQLLPEAGHILVGDLPHHVKVVGHAPREPASALCSQERASAEDDAGDEEQKDQQFHADDPIPPNRGSRLANPRDLAFM